MKPRTKHLNLISIVFFSLIHMIPGGYMNPGMTGKTENGFSPANFA
jgi:hypothetical protein